MKITPLRSAGVGLLSLFFCFTAVFGANPEQSAPPAPEERVPRTEMGIAQLPNEKLECHFDGESDVSIHGIDRTSSPADSVIAVGYEDEIRRVWKR